MLKYIVSFIFFFQICSNIFAQTPGGISNTTLWLDASSNAFLSSVAVVHNDKVDQWVNKVTNLGLIDLTQSLNASRPVYKANPTKYLNYNPILRFNSTNAQNLTQNVLGSNLFNSTDNTIIMVHRYYSGTVYFKWEQGWSGNRVGYESSGANVRMDFPNDNIGNRTVSSFTYDSNGQIVSTTSSSTQVKLRNNGKQLTTNNITGTLNTSFTSPLTIGDNVSFSVPSTIEYAELIVFDKTLTALELNKVESYLAIKYGITIDNTGGGNQGDYKATNGVIIWDASVSPSYHNDVIGIGRDDVEVLTQKQSHTLDDFTRIYIDNLLSGTNSGNLQNAGTITQDRSYVVVGHNNGQRCATVASNSEMPAGCGLYSRLEREWKVTKTSFSQPFNMDIKLASCANTGSVNISHLRFLVDDDGDFSNGGTTCYFNGDGSGINITYSGTTITVSGISNTHISDNSTQYVTIGSIDVATPLPIELLNFNATPINNRTVQLDWITNTEINNDYFTIEKSRDGINWFELIDVPGAGNSIETISYQDFDYSPFSGTSYYRLKQTDFDGAFTYSNVRVVNFNALSSFLVYPNPTNGKVSIKATKEELKTIHIFNVVGEEILNQTQVDYISETEIDIDFSELATGVYYIKTNSYTEMLVVE